MMNLPTLPTDNLYKFLALSGLVIALFSSIFPSMRISEIKQKSIEVETQIELLGIDTGYLETDIIDTLVSKGNLSPKDKEHFRKYLFNLLKKNDVKEWDEESEPILSLKEQAPFRSRLNELRKKIAEVKGQRKKYIALLNEVKSYHWMLLIGGLFGLVMSSLGFWLWYLLVQKPNDILLRKQLDSDKN